MPPDGFLADARDCDDSDPQVHPGVEEVCDGADNDCDGLTDDADPGVDPDSFRVWHIDEDRDGFGRTEGGITRCSAEAGFSDLDGDCDDRNPDINPGVVEVCDNQVDDNCDGDAWPCGFEGSLGPSNCLLYTSPSPRD